MSTSLSTPRKRPSEVDENELPVFDDPADLVNAVISTLQSPEERTNVAETYANDRNLATKVQAYAKIAGSDWTFYVKSLEISIGRNTEQSVVGSTGANQAENSIDIDLGPAKVVSRQHATINYNLDSRCWELKVLGRNGARMDGVKIPVGSDHSTQLNSGAILDVGGTQMMFILPDSPPTIHPKMLSKCLQKYKENAQAATKMRRLSNSGLKNFHVYDKTIQSPSAVSATSLQSNLDQDLSHEDAKDIKPPYSYATMITQAILSDSDGVMSLSEIYSWIASHYAYYKYSKTGWQNSIRHNLSLNKAFEKVPRRPNEPGKGMKWQISESYKDDFLTKITNGSLSKNRRGSSVSRQLHLHLATHKNLPESQKKGEDSIESQMIHNREARNTQNIQNQNQNIQNQAQNQNQIQNQSQSQNLQLGQANFTGTFPANFQQNQQQFPPNFQSPQFPIHQRTGSLPKIGPYAANRGAVPQNMINPLAYMQGNQAPQANGFSGMPRYGYQAAAPQWYGPQGDQIQQNINDGELNQNGQMNQNQQMHIPQNQIHQQNHQLNQNSQPNLAANTNGANSIRSPEMDSKSKLGSSSDSSGVISSQVGPSISVSAASTAPLADDSPKKLEAFTPERGSRLNKSLAPHPNQSSPAFWNFVQFSTPNGQTPMRKNSEESTQASPTLSRKVLNERVSSNSASSGQASDESPLKTKDLLDEKKSLST